MTPPAVRKTRRWPFALLLVFCLGYNLFRIALFVATLNGFVQTDQPLSPTLNAVVVYSELGIGLVGLVAIPGLLRSKPWGFWVTVAASAYATVFDAAAAIVVQLSAAGGVVPPVAILLLLVVFRPRFFPATPQPAALSGVRAEEAGTMERRHRKYLGQVVSGVWTPIAWGRIRCR